MWALRHAASRGLKPHFLSAPIRREHYRGRAIAYRYYAARSRCVEKVTGRAVIEVTPRPRRVLQALHADEQIVSVADVPADQVLASEPIEVVGQRARVPRGLMRLAAEAGVPVTVYLLGIRLADGKRTLRIFPASSRGDPGALLREVFSHLDEAIAAEPAAWHFWQVAPRFFDAGGER
jgi:lauroyl/myristoyl acyltransferase